MGGRGQSSASSRASVGAGSLALDAPEDYSRGAGIAEELGVTEKRGAEMFDAINRWARHSFQIKNSQRGGDHTEQDKKDADALEEFISKSPSYQGELIRVLNVEGYEKPRKGGKIHSDGSVTSWTVPSNYQGAKQMFGYTRESGTTVVLHVKATKGASIARYVNNSIIAGFDDEVLQSGGYDGSLTVKRVTTKRERDHVFPEGRDVVHVYLKE